MINSFDTEVAMDVGINAAILYKNIQYWCEKNQTNGQNEHDGLFWTYNSLAAFCEQFPYLTKRQVEKALIILEENGYIKTGNFNKVAYDRTKWYADIRNVKCISPTGEIDCAKKGNGNHTEVKPIPNINTNIKPNKEDIYIVQKSQKAKFIPPTIDEVRDYCDERGNDVDPEKFISYYESNGWMVGRNHMKDWKAAIRTWEKNSYGKPLNSSPSYQKPSGNPFADLLEKWEDEDE
jgi:hypothetical protein